MELNDGSGEQLLAIEVGDSTELDPCTWDNAGNDLFVFISIDDFILQLKFESVGQLVGIGWRQLPIPGVIRASFWKWHVPIMNFIWWK